MKKRNKKKFKLILIRVPIARSNIRHKSKKDYKRIKQIKLEDLSD